MRKPWLAAVLGTVCLAAGAADDTSAKVKSAVTRCQTSLFTLKAVVGLEFRGQSQEIKVEIPSMAVDATGLLVAPNPEELINGLPQGVNIDTKGFQLILPDSKEMEAKVVGRDTDFGLIFLRLTGKDAPALPALPAIRATPLELGDQMLLMRRFSSSHPETVCDVARVTSVMQKPRLMYMASESAGPGSVVLSGEGELVGLSVIVKEQDPDTGRKSVLLVVLPIAQVLEAAKGIHPEGETPKPPEGEAPKDK